MRLSLRARETVAIGSRKCLARVRPTRGELSARLYGEYAQDVLRLLLPPDTLIQPGDAVIVADAPFVCVHTRFLPGHVAADVRRCAR